MREKKRKESKPEKPQELEWPAAAAVARRPATGDLAQLPDNRSGTTMGCGSGSASSPASSRTAA